MQNEPPAMRWSERKAVEIANAQLTRGEAEGRAIRIGNSAEFS